MFNHVSRDDQEDEPSGLGDDRDDDSESDNDDDRNSITVKDSNGSPLKEGDSVSVIKDLKVKGSSITLKRGTVIKKIKLTGDQESVDCKFEGSSIVLKTCFLRKA